MPTGQPDLDDPSLRLFSQVIVGCVKLTVKTNHHIHCKVTEVQSELAIIYVNSLPIFMGFCETESEDYLRREMVLARRDIK